MLGSCLIISQTAEELAMET